MCISNKKKQPLILSKQFFIPNNFNLNINNNSLDFCNRVMKKSFNLDKTITVSKLKNDTVFEIKLNTIVNNLTIKKSKTLFGTQTALLKNFIKGLQQNYKIKLQMNGIGFKIELIDSFILLKVGHSHTYNIEIPKDIQVILLTSTCIICYSQNWNLLTEFAAQIKRIKPVEPYKGKGIILDNETFILRKEGKKNKK